MLKNIGLIPGKVNLKKRLFKIGSNQSPSYKIIKMIIDHVMSLDNLSHHGIYLSNLSFPGTFSFAGEILIFCGLFQKNTSVMFLACLGIMLSAVYSIWLVNRMIFGNLKVTYIKQYYDLTRHEVIVLLPLFFYVLFFGVIPNIILNYIYSSALLLSLI